MNTRLFAMLVVAAMSLSACDLGMRKSGGAMPPPPGRSSAPSAPSSTPSTGSEATTENPTESTPQAPVDRMEKFLGNWEAMLTLPPGANNLVRSRLVVQQQEIEKKGPPILTIEKEKFTMTLFSDKFEGPIELLETIINCSPNVFNGKTYPEYLREKLKNSEAAAEVKDDTAAPVFQLEILDDGDQLRFSRPGEPSLLFKKKLSSMGGSGG